MVDGTYRHCSHSRVCVGVLEGIEMKTVIEMAREAGIEWDLIDEDEGQVWYITQAGLERFAELVRADERAACAELVYNSPPFDEYESELKAVYNAIRARSNT